MTFLDMIGHPKCRRQSGKAILVAGGLFFFLLASGCQTGLEPSTRAAANMDTTATAESPSVSGRIMSDLGLEVIAVRTTAAGNMLDFRFKVLDSEKAMPFFKKELKPYLIDVASGKVLGVPVPAKGGPMRPTSRDPRVGITYFMLFGNPGHFVKVGNQVTIVVGDLRVEDLTVE